MQHPQTLRDLQTEVEWARQTQQMLHMHILALFESNNRLLNQVQENTSTLTKQQELLKKQEEILSNLEDKINLLNDFSSFQKE